MLFFEHSAHEIVILLLRHCAMSQRYGDNVESCYILLRLLGHKIFAQPDPYCLTYYCPSNMVILSLHGGDLYSRWPSKSNYHSSACTTHNGAQHKVYTKNSTSILLNTTCLWGQVLNVIPRYGTVSPPAVPSWLQSPLKPRAWLYMEVVTDCNDCQRLKSDDRN